MIAPDQIVAEARSWIGTPFRWQQSAKGAGCDCKGLVWGVARELGLPEAESPFAAIPADRRGRVDAGMMKRGLAATFDRTDDPRPGDVLLLVTAGKAQHLGILTELRGAGGRYVHCWQRGDQKVIETRLPRDWRNPVFLDSAWRWKNG